VVVKACRLLELRLLSWLVLNAAIWATVMPAAAAVDKAFKVLLFNPLNWAGVNPTICDEVRAPKLPVLNALSSVVVSCAKLLALMDCTPAVVRPFRLAVAKAAN